MLFLDVPCTSGCGIEFCPKIPLVKYYTLYNLAAELKLKIKIYKQKVDRILDRLPNMTRSEELRMYIVQ